MSLVFNFKGDTNGGANRFFVKEGSDGELDYLIKGADVNGQIRETTLNEWLVEAALLYDGTVKSLGNVTGPVPPSQIVVQSNDIVKLGGNNVGGQYRFKFDSQSDAENFSVFFEEVADVFF